MKYILNLVLFCTVSFYSFAQQPAGTAVEPLKDIDSLFLKILKDQHVAGFAVAVVKGDQVIYSKGFGYRDLEHQKPVTPNTLFAIGSSSKAFTSALLGLLQKEGKLDLDGKATTYLPQLRFYNNEMNNQLTVRDMMCHRTGLSRYDTSWYLFNSNNRDSLLYRVRYMIPTYGIREKWQYNNYMFLAQGMIAEKLTGKTWEQNIKERFFDPLNMKRSNTSIFELQKDTDSSLPYTVDQDERIKRIPYYNISGMGPAGSINSSANDMTNWLKLWIGGGRFLAKEILPSSYVRAASSSQMVMSEALPKENADIFLSNYGLGWMISSYRGHYRVEHGGNINGFSALVSFFPSDELGIVVLTNQNSSKVPETIVSSIADRMFRLSPNDWNGKLNSVKAMAKTKVNKEKKIIDSVQVLHTKPSHALKNYIGLYKNPAYGTIELVLKKDSLVMKIGEKTARVRHYHYDIFEAKGGDGENDAMPTGFDLQLNFITGLDGKIENITIPLDENGKQSVFNKVTKPEK